jgi:arabinan endo-1,5-alpha-L-arabinosidase
VGSASARVLGGARLDDSGELALDGVDDYVDLPNGTLAALESATVVAWITWGGGVCWQRVFDFGHNDMGEDKQGSAVTSLFVTLATCPEGRLAGMAELPSGQFVAAAATAIQPSSTRQVALSFDASRSLLTLYLDGVRVAETSASFALAQLGDVNAWLGRSQWVQDYFARVSYDEFRIYDRALSRTEVRELFQRGADRP